MKISDIPESILKHLDIEASKKQAIENLKKLKNLRPDQNFFHVEVYDDVDSMLTMPEKVIVDKHSLLCYSRDYETVRFFDCEYFNDHVIDGMEVEFKHELGSQIYQSRLYDACYMDGEKPYHILEFYPTTPTLQQIAKAIDNQEFELMYERLEIGEEDENGYRKLDITFKFRMSDFECCLSFVKYAYAVSFEEEGEQKIIHHIVGIHTNDKEVEKLYSDLIYVRADHQLLDENSNEELTAFFRKENQTNYATYEYAKDLRDFYENPNTQHKRVHAMPDDWLPF